MYEWLFIVSQKTIFFKEFICGVSERFWIVVSCLYIFGITLLVAVVDGLVSRHLRRLCAARESALIHHYAKRFFYLTFWLSFFGYLVFPVPVSPSCYWVVSDGFMGFFLWLAVKTYKKYL